MKRFLIINIMILFIFSTSGVIINYHYSGNLLYSTSLFTHADSCCNDSDTCNCCHEKTKLEKINDDFNLTASSSIDFGHLDFVYEIVWVDLILIDTKNSAQKFHNINAPPNRLDSKIYLINSSFLC